MSNILLHISLFLYAFYGFLKAMTDRTLWGSDPDDDTPLWLDNWQWFQDWKHANREGNRFVIKLHFPGIPWIPIDAWHAMDALKMFVASLAGEAALAAMIIELWPIDWYWIVALHIVWYALVAPLITFGTKWAFYEILLWKNPIEGFRNWVRKVFKKK